MSILVWAPLIYIGYSYEKGTVDTLDKIKFGNECKIKMYVCLATVQIVWIFSCIIENFFGTLAVNGVQIFILWSIKSKLQQPVDKA